MSERKGEFRGGSVSGVFPLKRSIRYGHFTREFRVESKCFLLEIEDESFGERIRFSECAFSNVFQLSFDLGCAAWLASQLRRVLETCGVGFFAIHRSNDYRLWLESCANRSGVFLRISKAGTAGSVLSVIVPKGTDGQGWLLLEGHFSAMLKGGPVGRRGGSTEVIPPSPRHVGLRKFNLDGTPLSFKDAFLRDRGVQGSPPADGGRRSRTVWRERRVEFSDSADWGLVVVCERKVVHQPWKAVELELSGLLGRTVSLKPILCNRALLFCDIKEEVTFLCGVGVLSMGKSPGVVLRDWGQDLKFTERRIVSYGGWVALVGLPAHLWKKCWFLKIGEACGGLEGVDNRTEKLEFLIEARIKVKRNKSGFLPECVIVGDGASQYRVRLRPLSPARRSVQDRKVPSADRETKELVALEDHAGLENRRLTGDLVFCSDVQPPVAADRVTVGKGMGEKGDCCHSVVASGARKGGSENLLGVGVVEEGGVSVRPSDKVLDPVQFNLGGPFCPPVGPPGLGSGPGVWASADQPVGVVLGPRLAPNGLPSVTVEGDMWAGGEKSGEALLGSLKVVIPSQASPGLLTPSSQNLSERGRRSPILAFEEEGDISAGEDGGEEDGGMSVREDFVQEEGEVGLEDNLDDLSLGEGVDLEEGVKLYTEGDLESNSDSEDGEDVFSEDTDEISDWEDGMGEHLKGLFDGVEGTSVGSQGLAVTSGAGLESRKKAEAVGSSSRGLISVVPESPASGLDSFAGSGDGSGSLDRVGQVLAMMQVNVIPLKKNLLQPSVTKFKGSGKRVSLLMKGSNKAATGLFYRRRRVGREKGKVVDQ